MNKKAITKTIIISSKPGQLGNMLFLFSHLIAFGIENSISIKAPAFEEYAGYFKSTANALISSYPQSKSAIRSKWLRKLIYMSCLAIAKIISILKLSNKLVSSISIDWDQSLNLENEADLKFFNGRYIFLQGWLFRSDTLLQKHKKAVIDFFKPADTYLFNVNKIISTNEDKILIGVHIRQGDYKTFEGGKYFFEIPQYIELMKKANSLFPQNKVLFLICSDSSLNHEPFKEIPHIFGTGIALEDLYAFSKCSYIIAPPSTFTMWASFYGRVPLYQVHNPHSFFTIHDFNVVER